MNLTRRVVLTAAVGFFTNLTFAQSVQDGINFVDSQKYAKAKQNFTDLINQNPKDASNFFYLGNIYLTQFDPNFKEAQESCKTYKTTFTKSLSICSDGIYSFTNKEGGNANARVMDLLLKDTTLLKSDAMLARKHNLLTKEGTTNYDDLSIIRFIL